MYYGYAALPMEPDRLTYLTSGLLDACTVYNYETGKTGLIYDLAKGAGKDPYELFLSGSVSLLTIENPNADTDRELVTSGTLRQLSGPSAGPRLCQGDAGGHPLPSQQPDGKVPDLHRSGCTVPLQRPGAEQQ